MGKKLFAVLALALIAGCSKNTVAPTPAIVSGTVFQNGAPVSDILVLVLTESGNDIESKTRAGGSFAVDVPNNERVVGIAAATKGQSGIITAGEFTDTRINLESVSVLQQQRASPSSVQAELWYGMYDEKDGNLRFRYQYTFSRFVCINWMPWVFPYTISPDPNKWTSWDLTDFPPPWKGKKLLVPTRYRWWHGAVYGYSISQALYLIATK